MATGFGDWTNTLAAHEVFTQIATREIDRQRPASRLAEVVSIDKENRALDVKFIGEQEAVRVPYTSTAPANPGQFVAIGGTTHDRHVEDVIGTTDAEARLEVAEDGLNTLMTTIVGNEWKDEEPDTILDKINDFFGGITGGAVDFDELALALKGEYTGNDIALSAIQKIAKGFTAIFGGARIVNLAQLTSGPVNMLGPEAGFDTIETIDSGEGWSFDGEVGRTKAGCARFDAAVQSGGVLLPPYMAQVQAGTKYGAQAYLKWDGVVASAGPAFSARVEWYGSDKQLISSQVLSPISSPPASNASWVEIKSMNLTAPVGAEWMGLALVIESTVTAGTIWWDDCCPLAIGQSIIQSWVEGLPEALQNLFNWIESLVNQILGALGLGATGSLFDKILDLGDEMESWFGDSQGLMSNFDNLVNDLFTNPASVLGAIPQSLVTNLTTALGGFDTMFSQFATIAFGGAVVPINGIVQQFKDGWSGLGSRVNTVEADVVDLQGIAEALTGVIGYGSSYMSGSPGVNTTPTLMNFNTRLGGPNATVGCSLSDGRYTLSSKGLWRFEAQVRFWGAKYAPPKCFMDIVIRLPNGTEVTRLKAIGSSDDEITITNVMPAVVPVAGCTAEVQAWTSSLPLVGGNWRGIGGGIQTTRFSVFKISSETE